MAFTHPPTVRTGSETERAVRAVLPAATYGLLLVGTVLTATAVALVLAPMASDFTSFVLLVAGWLAMVAVSPVIVRNGTVRLARIEFGHRAPRTTRVVTHVVATQLAR